MQEMIPISSSEKHEFIDITPQVQSIVRKSKVSEGICHVYSMHTSASIVVNENADPSICLDTIDALGMLVKEGVWRHDKVDGNTDAHIKAAMLGASQTIPVKDSKLLLGTWQAVSFLELDGPRSRKVCVTVVGK